MHSDDRHRTLCTAEDGRQRRSSGGVFSLWFRQFPRGPWLELARGSAADCQADELRRRRDGYRGMFLTVPAGQRPDATTRVLCSN